MMNEWKVKYGDQEIPVTANDIVETLGRVLGREWLFHETNEKLKGDVQMKIVHEFDIQILELLKVQFSGAIEEQRKRHLHMRIPGKRRPAIKGKPGDVVDLTPAKEEDDEKNQKP